MTNVSNAKIDGVLICRTIDFDFTCPECKEAQKDDPTIVCDDRNHLRPHIYNKRSIRIAKELFDDPQAYAREMMGSQITGLLPLNDPVKVDLIMKSAPFALNYDDHKPQFVFVSLDPNGASIQKEKDTTSDYAFVTTFMEGGKFWVSFFFNCFLFF